MAVDLARLGIEINSRSALTANQRLSRLAVTGAATEKKMVSLATSSRNLNGRLAISAERFEKLGGTAKKIGRTLSMAVTLPLLGIGTASAKVAAEFEEEMTKINTLVGLSGDTVAQYRDEILDLSKEVGRGARELSRALFTVTSAGARGAEALEILEQAGKASAIGLGDTQDIARATTAVLQAYGPEAINAARATEILTSTIREGNLEASDLAPVIGRVLGIASQLGVSFEEIGANVATFTRLGVGAEEAIVGLRGVMNALIKPTSQGNEALKAVGLTFEDLRNQVKRDGLAATMQTLVEAFDGNDEALGRVIPNVRALSNVLGTAGAQGEAYTRILGNIQDGHGIVEDGFKTVGETAEQQWNTAKASLEAAAIELGQNTLPMMQELVNIVQESADWFASLDDKTQALITRWGLYAAAIGPVLWVTGQLVTIMPTLIGLVGSLNKVILANPWVAAASAIGLVATILAGKYLSSTKDATEATNDFEEAMAGSTKSVKEAAAALEELTLQQMLNSTGRAIDITKEKMAGLTQSLREDFERVKQIGADAGRNFQEFIEFRASGSDSGPAAQLLAYQKQLASLKEQRQLIPELNQLEVGRANILGTVGGNMERLSAYARERLAQTEAQIDKIRTELGLSTKYTEQVADAADETKKVAEATGRIVNDWAAFTEATGTAKMVDPLALMEEILLGFPVSINEAEMAMATLEASFNSALSQRARDNIAGMIEELQRLIDQMNGVKEATESTGETTDKVTESMGNLWQRAKKAFNEAKDSIGETEGITRELQFSFQSAFNEAIIGGERLGRVLQGLWEDIQRMVLQKTVTAPLSNFLSSFLGSYIGGGSDTQTQNASGGIFTGITESGNRQQFGEAGMEAVMPVARMGNGDLGVKAQGGGGKMEVNIINYTGENVETQEQQTANGGRKLDVMIGKAVADDIRRGGQVYKAMKDATGARRTTRRT